MPCLIEVNLFIFSYSTALSSSLISMSYIAYTNMHDWVILTVHNKETKANGANKD